MIITSLIYSYQYSKLLNEKGQSYGNNKHCDTEDQTVLETPVAFYDEM